MLVSKSEWYGWKNQEVTKEYLRAIEDAIIANTNALASGATLGDYSGEMTARLVGRLDAYRDMLNFNPEFIDEEE